MRMWSMRLIIGVVVIDDLLTPHINSFEGESFLGTPQTPAGRLRPLHPASIITPHINSFEGESFLGTLRVWQPADPSREAAPPAPRWYYTNPWRMPYATAAARPGTSNFTKVLLRWRLTVRGLITSVSATSRSVWPSATRRSTSSSRLVRLRSRW